MNPNEIDLANISSDDDGGDATDDTNMVTQMGFSSFGPQDRTSNRQQQHPNKRIKSSLRSEHDASSYRPDLTSGGTSSNGGYRAAFQPQQVPGRGQQFILPTSTSLASSSAANLNPGSMASVPALAATTTASDIASPFPALESHHHATSPSSGKGSLSTEPGVTVFIAPSSDLPATTNPRTTATKSQPPDLKPSVAASATGDPIYWDRSFIEDPWAELSPRRWGSNN